MRPTDMLAAFFLAGVAFLLAAAVAGILGAAGVLEDGRWLALHLAFVGGVSQFILGAGQFFVAAFLATDPPPRRLVRGQLTVWSAGSVLVAAGVPTGLTPLTDAGAALIVAGLGLFAFGLLGLERRSVQTARWAARWYYACAAGLGVGAVLGLLMARGVAWSLGSLLGAHLALNLAGWLGTAIVGTLHTFFPSLTHSRLRHPRLQGPTFLGWTGGVVALAAGEAFGVEGLAIAGWFALAGAAGLLGVNLLASARAAHGPLALPPRLVALAQVFLFAGLALALVALLSRGASAPLFGEYRPAVAALLLAGWIGLTVAGSLLHLLNVLHRVRHLFERMPDPTPAADRAVTALAGLAVVLLALSRAPGLDALSIPALAAVGATVLVLGTMILKLAVRAVASARLRI